MITGLVTGLMSSASAGGGGVSPTYMEPPVDTALASKTYHAFGFDRLVEGYTGDTVQLYCATASPTNEDFGFNATSGVFDLAAVDTWRSGADVDVVKFYDQSGNGGEFVSSGTCAFIRSDVVKRFGCDFNTSTGELTRSLTNGGVGTDLNNGAGVLYLTGSSISLTADGLETQILKSQNKRKSTVDGDSLGSSYAEENIFTYGVGSNAYQNIRWYFNFGYYSQLYVSSPAINEADIGGSPTILKKYGQDILGMKMDTTSVYYDTHLAESSSKSFGATAQTYLGANNFDNGKLVVGAQFSNAGGTTYSASNRGDFVFGGIILTKTLTSNERYLLKSKLALVGQQHQVKSLSDLEGLFDEYVLHKNINTGTNTLSGENGKISLLYNSTGTTTYNYSDPVTGLTGVRFASGSVNNKFVASDTYFAGTTTGTVVAIYRQENATSNLETPIQQSSTDEATASFNERSWSLGFDHDKPSFMTLIATARDTDSVMGSRRLSDNSTIGDQTTNQSNGKYNRNTTHNDFLYSGETIYGYSTSQAFWTNTDGGAPLTLDAPTGHHTLSNFDFPYKNAAPLIHIGTFKAPTGYDRADAYATRKPLILQGVSKSYLGLVGSAIGHTCSDVAINNNAGVVDSNDTSKIRSGRALGDFVGSCNFFGFALRDWTMDEATWFALNAYKLVA